jgi:hypothetical protein
MPTPAQIAANRRNAKKSAGPKTAEGKEAASRNALKHGLHAKDFACEHEGSADYADFAAALYADLAPADSVEEQLVDRIVTCTWRLQRITLAETAIFDTWGLNARDELRHGESPYSRLFDRRTSQMTALSRYESALDRAMGRAYALLERRQARRRGEAVAAPVTVLVEGLGDSADGDSVKSLADKANYESCGTKPILDLAPGGRAAES